MDKITSKDKKMFSKKLLKFQKDGLLRYGKYLEDQLLWSAKKEIRKHYKEYIEDQIIMNNEKIKKIEIKLMT